MKRTIKLLAAGLILFATGSSFAASAIPLNSKASYTVTTTENEQSAKKNTTTAKKDKKERREAKKQAKMEKKEQRKAKSSEPSKTPSGK